MVFLRRHYRLATLLTLGILPNLSSLHLLNEAATTQRKFAEVR